MLSFKHASKPVCCQFRPRWAKRTGQLAAARVLTLALLGGVLLSLLPGGTEEAHAAVSVLLEQPYGGLGTWNPTGHSALYFDHICAATPLRLRPCEPGELGVVISRYDGIGDYDWVAMPLIPYLYAVEDANEIPDSVDRLTVVRMRDLYRRQYLESVAPDTAEGGMPQGNWYELAGSAYDRTIYGFRVRTTAEQDEKIIAMLNDRPNVTAYSGAFRNCADFVRTTIDRMYPHAIRRNYVADFGLTTPKSVARGLTHYARKHPETALDEFVIPQVKGDLPRSMGVEGVTESLLTRYGIPMTILSPQLTAAVFVAYVGHGRFRMPKEAPVLDVAAMQAAAQQVTAAFAEGFAGPPAGSLPGMAAATSAAPLLRRARMGVSADDPEDTSELPSPSASPVGPSSTASQMVPVAAEAAPACIECSVGQFFR